MKPNQYFITKFAVEDPNEAELLQTRHVWDIMDVIRDAGAEGITSKKISEQLNLPYPTVADLTKRLTHVRWIISEPPQRILGRPRKGKERREFRKPSKVHSLKLGLHMPEVWDEFYEFCKDRFGVSKYAEQVRPICLVVDNVLTEVQANPRFAPKEPIHDDCGASHDGYECVSAILSNLVKWLLEDSEEFRNILIKHKLANREFFEGES